VTGKTLHEAGVAIATSVTASNVRIDAVIEARDTGLGEDRSEISLVFILPAVGESKSGQWLVAMRKHAGERSGIQGEAWNQIVQ
jgi:hypothetical protein